MILCMVQIQQQNRGIIRIFRNTLPRLHENSWRSLRNMSSIGNRKDRRPITRPRVAGNCLQYAPYAFIIRRVTWDTTSSRIQQWVPLRIEDTRGTSTKIVDSKFRWQWRVWLDQPGEMLFRFKTSFGWRETTTNHGSNGRKGLNLVSLVEFSSLNPTWSEFKEALLKRF